MTVLRHSTWFPWVLIILIFWPALRIVAAPRRAGMVWIVMLEFCDGKLRKKEVRFREDSVNERRRREMMNIFTYTCSRPTRESEGKLVICIID
jgi:hypothetical protein